MPKVKKIPATLSRYTATPIGGSEKRKVAGYARVSTDSEEQATSYEAQVDYYTKYIKAREDWEFVKVYTDDGISGTSTAHREGFKQMIQDSLDGKIDLIITKSVSRFARNTVDSLTTIRNLKDHHVECYFEKENIWTFDSKGELLITIMSSLAQEESRSISENVTWGQRKRFRDGKVSVAYTNFLGYDKGPDGKLVINKEQAKIVRMIFKYYLEGYSCHTIAKMLTQKGIKSPAGKDQWCASTIRNILGNEKYKGDALLQKTYTVNYLTKEKKLNHGEIPQYYVEDDHEAIIDEKAFDQVQAEMWRRFNSKERISGVGIFSSKIKCGECGGWYGAKVWHSNSKYRKVVYQCNHKFDNKNHHCTTPSLTEQEIKDIFIKAFNHLITNREEIISNLHELQELTCGTEELKASLDQLDAEIDVIGEKTHRLVEQNSRTAQNQEEYQKEYDELATEFNLKKSQRDKITNEIRQKNAMSKAYQFFEETLGNRDQLITEFDPELWGSMVEYITAYSKTDIRVMFRDGTEVKV